MNDNTNRERQFLMTPAVIEARKDSLQQLPMEELAEMFRIQDSSDPQAVVGRVSRTEKKNLIDRIVENMVKNHHPVIEERYQFVLWLYRIRAQHGNLTSSV
jgi:hypothetical protein